MIPTRAAPNGCPRACWLKAYTRAHDRSVSRPHAANHAGPTGRAGGRTAIVASCRTRQPAGGGRVSQGEDTSPAKRASTYGRDCFIEFLPNVTHDPSGRLVVDLRSGDAGLKSAGELT